MLEQPYLETHLGIVHRQDELFRAFWDRLTPGARTAIESLWWAIEGTSGEHLESRHSSVYEATKRWFVRVQEKEFEYSKIPEDWVHLVRNPDAKLWLYERSLERLNEFLQISGIAGAEVYGGVKPNASLDRKLFESRHGNAVQVNILDLWDVVRFRIVTGDLDSLIEIAIKFWERLFDDILRCRNYYFRPRLDDPDDAYRAIHLEVADEDGWMIEVQIMTRCREAVGLLDHAFLFKRSLPFVDENHKAWLLNFSKKGNIYDFSRSEGPVTDSSAWRYGDADT